MVETGEVGVVRRTRRKRRKYHIRNTRRHDIELFASWHPEDKAEQWEEFQKLFPESRAKVDLRRHPTPPAEAMLAETDFIAQCRASGAGKGAL